MSELLPAIIGFLLMGMLCVLLEKLWPEDAAQPWWRSDSLTDIIYFAMRIALSLLLVLATALTGHSIPGQEQSLVGSQPFWLQVVEVLLLSDLLSYWVHYFEHHVYLLWRFHAIHHSAEKVDWLVATRVHPVELVLGKLMMTVPLYLAGFSPDALAVTVPFVAAYSLFLHANITWDFGPFRYVLSSPAFHRWHHSVEHQALDMNLAQLFPFYDYLFGTLYFPKGSQSQEYGLRGQAMPTGVWQQLLYPLFGDRPRHPHGSDSLQAAPVTLSNDPVPSGVPAD